MATIPVGRDHLVGQSDAAPLAAGRRRRRPSRAVYAELPHTRKEIAMTFKQYALMVAVGLLGLYTLVLLANHGALTVPNPERAALTGARALAHAELERLESVVPAGRVRDDGLWKTHLHVVETELASCVPTTTLIPVWNVLSPFPRARVIQSL